MKEVSLVAAHSLLKGAKALMVKGDETHAPFTLNALTGDDASAFLELGDGDDKLIFKEGDNFFPSAGGGEVQLIDTKRAIVIIHPLDSKELAERILPFSEVPEGDWFGSAKRNRLCEKIHAIPAWKRNLNILLNFRKWRAAWVMSTRAEHAFNKSHDLELFDRTLRLSDEKWMSVHGVVLG